MICEENVCKIVMVTNLVENGKIKCEKYWPETEENYGNINVSLKDKEICLDYVVRTFLITQGKRTWILKHFHYITWPDHDVPRFTNSVVSFLQKVRNFKPKSNSPIVVHCSAGDGRTGTLILLDSMLDMAYSEARVDLVSYLTNMRQQRINIVETYAQYRFVYRALADCLCEFKTSILCSDYNEEIDRLKKVNASTGKTGFHIQYEVNKLTYIFLLNLSLSYNFRSYLTYYYNQTFEQWPLFGGYSICSLIQ
ncbi:receptor-type tyrosine-protein phosphatase T-like [Centruroides sculpturatus]|uniref:receptor-type tyrosine-protein phosphatase T-like n=1 Tax=Centruroides sculpturatus TaxID=218467 RepID=UPI000C6CD8FA|nr:receptor-type tyrosine-protein phosphatase T-like [Centruroides sculpturatus]XP_023243746.1 receptor-type tyrosine-protein phosphatase T-like [Centruroides sculpturatus]XP_023243747.1 receptor-type tyrosine-protein phosphatase T-like [Centruroides sculpturatus]XP_023243748.1 receptor-type tyrosine-protein phosphatase T-like [Centruroides sculpturatus]